MYLFSLGQAVRSRRDSRAKLLYSATCEEWCYNTRRGGPDPADDVLEDEVKAPLVLARPQQLDDERVIHLIQDVPLGFDVLHLPCPNHLSLGHNLDGDQSARR